MSIQMVVPRVWLLGKLLASVEPSVVIRATSRKVITRWGHYLLNIRFALGLRRKVLTGSWEAQEADSSDQKADVSECMHLRNRRAQKNLVKNLRILSTMDLFLVPRIRYFVRG